MDKEEYILVKYGSRLTVGVAALFYLRILPDTVFDLFFCKVYVDALREHMADVLTDAVGPYNDKCRNLSVAAHLEATVTKIEIALADIKTNFATAGKPSTK